MRIDYQGERMCGCCGQFGIAVQLIPVDVWDDQNVSFGSSGSQTMLCDECHAFLLATLAKAVKHRRATVDDDLIDEDPPQDDEKPRTEPIPYWVHR